MRKQKAISLVLCAALFAAMVFCPAASADGTDSISITGANREILPEYEHYDPEQFYKDCTRLEEGNWEGKTEEAMALYDALYQEINHISSIFTTINVMHDENVTDDYLSQEYQYTDSMYTRVCDAFLSAAHALAVGPCAEALKERVHPLDFTYMQEYTPVSEEEMEILDRLTELETQYDTLMVTCGEEIRGTVDGKEYPFSVFMTDGELPDLEQEKLLALYLECIGKLNSQAGAIYLEMVPLRNQIARMEGYDNYCDYADKEGYGRDFGTAEAKQFHTAVKRFFSQYGSVLGQVDTADQNFAASELVGLAGQMMGGVSEKFDEAYSYFTKNRLYSLGNDDSRSNGAYTMPVSEVPGAAVIYLCTYGNSYDLTSLIHELGHFTNFHNMQELICYSLQFEVAEIHSTGLQMLAASRYDKVMDPDSAEDMLSYELDYCLSSIQDGCLYDEWQREIYTRGDMTLEEINDLFYQLKVEYGYEELYGMEYDWMYVSHNFTAPMYYISYAVSAVAALELWEMSETDYAGAVKTWEGLLGSSEPYCYFDRMKDAGLSTFTDQDAVEQVLSEATQTLMYSIYDGESGWDLMDYLMEYFDLWGDLFEGMQTPEPTKVPQAV